MIFSDWIAVGALIVAAAAFGLGEWRAHRAKMDATERNLVDWDVRWTGPNTIELVCLGPDEARDVFVKFDVEEEILEGSIPRLRRGEHVSLEVHGVSDLWEKLHEPAPSGNGYVIRLGKSGLWYSCWLSWRSPRGRVQEREWKEADLEPTASVQ